MAWNQELKWGNGPEVDSYGTRPEGDVTKVAWIGNLLGIDWEWRQLLDCESGSYAGVERRRDKWDSIQRL